MGISPPRAMATTLSCMTRKITRRNSFASPPPGNVKAASSPSPISSGRSPRGKWTLSDCHHGRPCIGRNPEAVRSRRVHQISLPARPQRGDAEALAEYLHKKMREELGIAGEDSPHIRDLCHQKYRGSRYSFGYPACPNLEDQTKLFALLHPEENVGVRLTGGFLLDPEQSTSAIVVHHHGAKYFVV